jgi:hypothetical protein
VIEEKYIHLNHSSTKAKHLKIKKYLCTLDDKYEIIDDKFVILTDEKLELKRNKKRCINRLKIIKEELLLKSWHPTRFIEWCLDITELFEHQFDISIYL